MKNQKRTVQIHCRVTESEYNTIKDNEKIAGLNLSDYYRRSLLGEKIVASPPVDFTIMIREIKRVGSNLNQLNHKLNVFGIAHPLEIERNSNDIREVIRMLYRTYRPGKGDG